MPLTHQELTDRRIAEFALEESRLSNLAYRFKLAPRDRVWKNWDRTEFEPNHYRLLGLAGVCLKRDEQPKRASRRGPGARGRGRHPLLRRAAGAGRHRAQLLRDLRDRQPSDALRRDHRASDRRLRHARSPPSKPPSPAAASPERSCRRSSSQFSAVSSRLVRCFGADSWRSSNEQAH